MMNSKSIDRITALLLFFAFFLTMLFFYLKKVEHNINEYMTYHDSVVELKLINKSFDNFLVKQSTFINFDEINLKVTDFRKEINTLDSEYVHGIFGPEYSVLFEDTRRAFQEKEIFIEKYKSNNASLLNSMHYIFDLQESIQKNEPESLTKIVSKQTLLLMKYYLNNYSDKQKIYNNLDLLKQSFENENTKELELFILHIKKKY